MSMTASPELTIVGSAVGLVVLKRLADAVRDRDNIRAVILGTGLNNDGSDKVGYTAPSTRGQSNAIRAAAGAFRRTFKLSRFENVSASFTPGAIS